MLADEVFVFVVKQKTADEMRISDWSSDVCSADRAMTWDGGKNGVARFELTPEGARTRLVLTHTGIGDSGHRKGTAAGWRSHLAVLAGRLSGHPVRDFWKLHAESMKAVFGG